jgi:hypothetical protein
MVWIGSPFTRKIDRPPGNPWRAAPMVKTAGLAGAFPHKRYPRRRSSSTVRSASGYASSRSSGMGSPLSTESP